MMSSRELHYAANGLGDRTPDPVTAVVEQIGEEAHGHKQAILAALHKYGMAQDVSTLSSWLSWAGVQMNPREIVKTLWSMQKNQLVSFKERAGGGLFKIRMTSTASARFEKPKRERAPIEQVAPPKKPDVVPSAPYDYVLPEEPRYAAPPPPAQNIRSFTDENTYSAEVHGSSAEVHGKDEVVDTHTQYRPGESYNVYPDMKGRGGYVTQRVAARFVEGLDKIGGSGTKREAASALGEIGKTPGRSSVWAKAALHWGWIAESDNGRISITREGREILRQYRELGDHDLRGRKPDRPRGRPAPMEVVRRDEHDAEKKVPVTLPVEDAPVPPLRVRDEPDLDNYPLIKDLMGKQERIERYEQAAKLLGDDEEDIVLQLLEKTQLTDLEKEVIRYVSQVQA